MLLIPLVFVGTVDAGKLTIFRVPYKGSRVLRFKLVPSQISVGDSKVADVKGMGGRSVLVTGRSLGQTYILATTSGGRSLRYLVEIEIPGQPLAAKIKTVFPREQINVDGIGNTLVLSGAVSDSVISERVAAMAVAYVQGMGLKGKILNFLSIRGKQQVQLRVKIAEVSRSALRQLGVNFWYRDADVASGMLAPGTKLDSTTAPDLGQTGTLLQPGGGASTATGLSTQVPFVPMLTPAFTTDAFGLLFATDGDTSFPMSIALNLLHANGLAKVLSEPTLVAYSGQNAKFLSGGEFPVPIPQALGQVGIEYKKFGVQLEFQPMVMANNTIHLRVSVAVSDKDSSGAVLIQGTSVPALSTRHSETTVRLKSGQSFAIAGLLQDRLESSSGKIPLLGDIPVLGMLFRRSWSRRHETELVILATAQLVQPLKPGEVPPLPGEDEASDPSSISFFLMGTVDAGRPKRVRRGPAGPVGFSK